MQERFSKEKNVGKRQHQTRTYIPRPIKFKRIFSISPLPLQKTPSITTKDKKVKFMVMIWEPRNGDKSSWRNRCSRNPVMRVFIPIHTPLFLIMG